MVWPPLRTACLPKEGSCRRTMFVASGFSLDYFEGRTDGCSERMLKYFVQGSECSFSSLLYGISSGWQILFACLVFGGEWLDCWEFFVLFCCSSGGICCPRLEARSAPMRMKKILIWWHRRIKGELWGNKYDYIFLGEISNTLCKENWWKGIMLEARAKLGQMASLEEERTLLW